MGPRQRITTPLAKLHARTKSVAAGLLAKDHQIGSYNQGG
jgi:hypothetical protein